MGGQTSSGTTMYISAAELAEWYRTARPGHWVTYAVGPALDQREAVAATVKLWIDQGTVTPSKVRIDGVLRHRVARRAKNSAPAAEPRRIARPEPGSEESQLFHYIERLTVLGLPMPSNAAIAGALGWRDRDQVAYRLRRLIERDFVRVPPAGRFATRIVTVTETGLRTADRVLDKADGREMAA